MSYTIKLLPNKQREKAGIASIRFYISANSEHDYINTGVSWGVDLVDTDRCTLVRGRNILTEYTKANEKIKALKERIEEVFTHNPSIGAKRVKFLIEESPKDFVSYAEKKAFERQKSKEITYRTYQNNMVAIGHIKHFCGSLPFHKISVEWLESFKAELHKKGYGRNTIWTRLKDVRRYMNLARKDKIFFEYPFGGDFKMPKLESRVEFLYENDFSALKNYYFSELPTASEKPVLRAFLFSCYTSIRISDINAVRGKNIKNGNLDFEPQKGFFSETKTVKRIIIPLHEIALKLIGNPKKEELVFFDFPSDQKANARLKKIAQKLGINKEITFHYSRHTFATRFLAAGGKVETLQKIMGHEKIETTMIYVHVEPSRKATEINLMT